MDIKKFITLENGVKVGAFVLSVGSLLLTNKKESMDMKKLKDDVTKDVLTQLSENK